jgi:hypothetical protein
MLPLLEYSTKKAQILRDYFEALSRELYSGEPWHDVHRWAILTGQLENLFEDTLQLYISALRTDEFHHYTAFTSPDYAYVNTEERLQSLFYTIHWLLVNELDIIAKIEAQGHYSKQRVVLEQCIKEVNTILAGESPAYSTAQFQTILQQSLDDVNSGRVEEMFPES